MPPDPSQSQIARELVEAYAREHRRSGRARRERTPEPPHPLEYDESGLPRPQAKPSFVERVARLLNPL